MMYELDEDYFLRSDDLAKKYVDNIISVLDNTKPGIFKELIILVFSFIKIIFIFFRSGNTFA